jgi:hypothetical protein
MADSEEMRRLILHAASLLDGQRERLLTGRYDVGAVMAATSFGSATLQMVAACMGVEEQSAPKTTAKRDEHGRFLKVGAS